MTSSQKMKPKHLNRHLVAGCSIGHKSRPPLKILTHSKSARWRHVDILASFSNNRREWKCIVYLYIRSPSGQKYITTALTDYLKDTTNEETDKPVKMDSFIYKFCKRVNNCPLSLLVNCSSSFLFSFLLPPLLCCDPFFFMVSLQLHPIQIKLNESLMI